ncbi:MAG: DUF3892 domain-containing protein [Fibrobacteria bacterium]
MPVTLQILCIRKTYRMGPHEKIQFIGGKNADGTAWSMTIESAIQGIREGKWDFHARIDGAAVPVIVAEHFGAAYLKTKPDWTQKDNLPSLPECPK